MKQVFAEMSSGRKKPLHRVEDGVDVTTYLEWHLGECSPLDVPLKYYVLYFSGTDANPVLTKTVVFKVNRAEFNDWSLAPEPEEVIEPEG